MPDVTTSLLQLVLQETGNNNNNWGEILNDTLQRIEDAIADTNSVVTTGGTTTLTDDEALSAIQIVTGVLGSNATIAVPNHTRPFIIRNSTTGAYTVSVQRAGGGAAVTIPQSKAVWLYSDGTDVKSAADILDGSIDAGDFAASAVDTAAIANSAVTTAKIADANVTAAKIADDAVGNAKLAFDGGPFSGFRNRIINGDFRIDQRYIGAASSLNSSPLYFIDRWYASSTGASATIQQVAGSSGSPYRVRFTGAASMTGVSLSQRIERLNSADMAGGVATLSLRAASSSLTTLNWALSYATANDTFTATTSIATGSFTINSTEALYEAANISIPGGATTGLQLTLAGGALLSGQTLTIGDVCLESGPAALPFERRPYATELALCQRYFEKTFPFNVAPANSTGNYSGAMTNITGSTSFIGNTVLMWRFMAEKRITPTVQPYNPRSGGLASCMSDGGGFDSSPTLTTIGTTSASWYNSGAGLSANSFAYMHATASAEL